MSLPKVDIEYLNERGIDYELADDSGMACLIFRSWPLPPGYDIEAADLLLRLSPGYPDVNPDMWWFDPPVRLADGSSPPATDVVEQYLGRSWQRWSRHFTNGQWQSGVDGLESFLALVRRDIERSAPAEIVQ